MRSGFEKNLLTFIAGVMLVSAVVKAGEALQAGSTVGSSGGGGGDATTLDTLDSTDFALDDLANVPNNSVTDAMASNTLTCSLFSGSGSTTTAIDLATAEVAGVLADANVSDTLQCSLFVGSGSSTSAIDLATAEVAGVLPDANVSDTLQCSLFVGSGSSTSAIDLATAEVAGITPIANGGTGSGTLAGAGLFTTANDGSGSGLDADLLDGISSALLLLVDLSNIVADTITDAMVSNTLTASLFVGSGSTTTAVDLATAEVNGEAADANVSNTLTSSLFVGSGSSTTAIDLATAEVAGTLPDGNVSDTLTASLFVGSGSSTTAVDLATAEVAGTLPIANVATTTVCLVAGGSLCPMTLSSTTVALDFNSNDIQTFTTSGAVTFTDTNNAAGRSKSVIITADASGDTLAFPAWTWVMTAPTSIAANKVALLSVLCASTTEASCVAAYSVQP